MKKSMKLMAVTAMTALLFSVGVANADYQPSQDQTINITSPISVPNLGTAEASFQAQQAIPQTVTNLSGVSYNYDYIWVDVNGTPVLAIDPPCPMF
jgi:hypothetical protein